MRSGERSSPQASALGRRFRDALGTVKRGVLNFLRPPLEIERAPSNSLTGRPIWVSKELDPWLSLRKEDGYGDTRFYPPLPFLGRFRPPSKPALGCARAR